MFRVALAGWALGAGTLTVIAPNFSIVDPGLWIAALLITRARRPNLWLVLLVGSIAVALPWSADPVATALTAARIYTLGVIGTWLVANWDARAFAIGIVLSWGIQVPYLILGIVDADISWLSAGRQVGLTRYATILGTGAYLVHAAIPDVRSSRSRGGLVVIAVTWFTAAIALAASGARAPAGALGIQAIASRSWSTLLVTAATGVIFVAVAFQEDRVGYLFDIGQIRGDVAMRVATAAPDRVDEDTRRNVYQLAGSLTPVTTDGRVEFIATAKDGTKIEVGVSKWRALGTGAGAYLDANPWPRPHNIYSIVWHELGVLAIVPASIAAWAAWTRRIPIATMAGLAALGLLDDTVVSQAEGHFILVGVIVAGVAAARRDEGPIVARAASQRPACSRTAWAPGSQPDQPPAQTF